MKYIRIILGITILVLCLTVWSFAQAMDSSFALVEFEAAQDYYKRADYTKAIEAYEKVIQQGYESGFLYYNLANSYFKNGESGRAILNYEKARRFIPRDSDLNYNYQYVRSIIPKTVAPTPSFVRRIISDLINFYTLDEIFVIFLIGAFLLATGHIVSLYLRWPVLLKRGCVTIFSVVGVLAGVCFFVKINSEINLAVAVIETRANFEPKEDATSHFTLWEGTKVKILKEENQWMKIQRSDGKLGWISSDTIERIAP